MAMSTAPFDHAKADTILRSSDGTDFRIFKLFITLSSPSFEPILEPSQIKDGLEVVYFPENAKTLDSLLRFCYPCTLSEDPKMDALEDIIDILRAARKYSLGTVERKALHALSDPKIIAVEPFRCFAVARYVQAHEETLLAAKHTLTQSCIPPWFPEIDLISAGDLLTLLAFHRRCGEVAYALSDDMSWIESHFGSREGCLWFSASKKNGCRCSRISTAALSKYKLFGREPFEWWEHFMQETFRALQDRPCATTVATYVARAILDVKTEHCSTCSASVIKGIQDVSCLLIRKVEEIVSEGEHALALTLHSRIFDRANVMG